MSFERALQRHQQGKIAEAQGLYEQLLKRQPRHAGALHNLGLIALQSGQFERGERLIRQALKIAPSDPAMHASLGLACLQLGRPGDALASLDRALQLKPNDAQVHGNRGMALTILQRPAEALASYDRALALNPRYPEALSNRANVLTQLDRLEEALASADQALKLQPRFVDAIANRSGILHNLNRLDEAVVCCEQVLAARPDSVNAHWNAALVRLVMGDFAQGLPEYEWRWRHPTCRTPRRDLSQPLWLGGEPLAGRTILLHCEQGLGDTIQFCRYARLLADRGARVLLEVQPALRSLLARVPGVSEVFTWGDPLPAFDLHCPLLSLPLALKTELNSIPGGTPYLEADEGAVQEWRRRLGVTSRRRVGLVWSGNPHHINDRHRSIPLRALARLNDTGVQLISLQKEVRPADQALLDTTPDILDLGPQLTDFNATAGLMACLDLIISVDTAPVHLAGALGRPVWLLLPFSPDWRWLMDRDDSPWYPSARLFRQPGVGDWDSVIERVDRELRGAVANSALRPAGRS